MIDPVHRRGRPRTHPDKLDAFIGIRAPGELADAMFLLAHRKRTDVSTITRAIWMRLLQREGITLSGNSGSDRCPAPSDHGVSF